MNEPIATSCSDTDVETGIAVGLVAVVAILGAVLHAIAAVRGQNTPGSAVSFHAVVHVVLAIVALLSGVDYGIPA